MKNFPIIISSLVLFAFYGCEETIHLDLEQTKSAIVIEGLITNSPGKQYVKISRTAGFYASGATASISTASVLITDDHGTEIVFYHNPTDEPGKEGYYFADADFTGQIGHRYSLSVVVDDVMYEAEDELLPVTPIDSLSYRINETQQKNPHRPEQIYEIVAYLKEPQETKDYYLFKFFRNDSLHYFNPGTDIYFASDEWVGENLDGLSSPVYFQLDDIARLEISSLSRDAFLFYSDLSNLLNSDGGMISPPPANPRTNLSNGALGFFRTSAVDTKSISIH